MKHPYFGNLSLFKVVTLMILAFMLFPLAVAVAGAFALGGEHSPGTVLGIAGVLTMTDLAKANTSDVVRPMVEEAVGDFPELVHFPAEQLGAGELTYQTLVRSAYPSANFVDMGAGYTASKSATRLERFEVFPFGGRVVAARMIADNWKRGGAAGYFAFEGAGIMKAAMFAIAKQIWYGRGADGKGFPGLKNFTAFGSTVTDPLTGKVYPMVINATGTTASTASSVYLVRFSRNPETNPDGVQLEFGLGSVFELPEPRIGDIADPTDATKQVEAYISVLQGFAGLQTPNVHCVRRICNLTDDVGKGLTDALLARALATFPANQKPDAIFVTSNQQRLLQIARTVVLQGQGQQRPDQPNVAPLPTSYGDIPIYATDAIGDTDAIEVAAAAEE